MADNIRSNHGSDSRLDRGSETFDLLRALFLRSHSERQCSLIAPNGPYEYYLMRLFDNTVTSLGGQSFTPEDHKNRLKELLAGLLKIFVEDVGLYDVWLNTVTIIDELLTPETQNDPTYEFALIRKLLVHWNNQIQWLPFLHAWNQISSATGSVTSDLISLIDHGDFTAINCADIHIICAHVRAKVPQIEPFFHEFARIGKLIPGVSQCLAQFAALIALRIFDPAHPDFVRGLLNAHASPIDVVYLNPSIPAQPPQLCADGASLSRATCILIALSIEPIQSVAPKIITDPLINMARASIGDISLTDERLLTRALIYSPLITTQIITTEKVTEMRPIVQLCRGNFIGFDGSKYIIACGPLDHQHARLCLNIERIGRRLGVSRNNGPSRVLECPSKSLFYVFDAPMETIPDKQVRPAEMFGLVRNDRNARNTLVLNCLWRFIMNLPGSSASANILMIPSRDREHSSRIFSYNESAISRQEMKAVHHAILELFAQELTSYGPIIQSWIAMLREITDIECATCAKIPNRAQLTGIDHTVLSKCTARATLVTDIWINQLKKL